MSRRRQSHVSCIPNDVLKDQILWEPDWSELGLARWRAIKVEIDRQNARLKKNEQKAQRIQEQADRERIEMDKLLEVYTEQLRKPLLAEMHKRLSKAEKEIKRGLAKFERNELLRRGVVRGRRQR